MVTQASLFDKAHKGREDFLAGMIATWRYGDAPKKAEKEHARILAAEMNDKIQDLP